VVLLALAVALLAILLVAACGGGKKSGATTTTLQVTLKEWSVETSKQQVKPGPVTFQVSNQGTMQHDFVVIKSDLPPDGLPVNDTGLVSESQVNTVSHMVPFAAGSTQSLTLDLTPGKYLLICNIVEMPQGGKPVSHYRNGMVASLLVEP
jgi:uncharacterized cupredoxin-like copper-binding protein